MSNLFGLQSPVTFAVFTRSQLDDVLEGRVTLGAIKVYLALYARADFRDWSCFPSFSVLQGDAGVSRDTVTKAVAQLVERGWIEKTKRRARCRQGKNHYTLPHPASWVAGAKIRPGQSLAEQGQVDQTLGPQSLAGQGQLRQSLTSTHSLNEEPKTSSLGAAPPARVQKWTSSDFERVFSAWGGRKSRGESRARFFELDRVSGWTVDGERGLLARLSFFEKCYRKLGWALPPLQAVLKADQEKLTDAFLEGLESDAETAEARGRRS